MIAEALEKVGTDGVITVEESQTFGMELDFVEGMRFDKGYISPYFVTDTDRMEAVLDDAYILLAPQQDLGGQGPPPVLEKVMQSGRPLVIIAEDVEGEALATLVVNKIRGTFKSVAIKAPGFGERRKAMLQDMAILTGGQVDLRGDRPQAREHRRSTLLGSRPQGRRHQGRDDDRRGCRLDSSDVNGRITQIRTEIENTDSDYDREKLQERLAKLAGGVAIIKVGAATEVELKEKKHRIEDAVQTAKASVEEGVVPGGGVALLRAQEQVLRARDHRSRATRPPAPSWLPVRSRSRSSRSRSTPASRAASSWRRSRASRAPTASTRATGEYEDLVKAGVIDAAKVTRSALQNAASIAALFLTTEAVIADKPEPAGAPAGMPGGMPGMGGMGDF